MNNNPQNNQLSKVNIVNEKIGIGMIVSSLAVIVFTVAMFLYQQKNEDAREVQHQGISLVRLLGSMPVGQLMAHGNTVDTLRLLKETQVNPYFAYASLVDVKGVSINEYAAPGIIITPMSVPALPSQWLGERKIDSPKNLSGAGTTINEYFSPVIEKGELQAFIRLGYLEPGYSLTVSQVRLLAIMAMAIFLLTPFFYFMIKNEIKPLASIGVQLQTLLKKTETSNTDVTTKNGSQDFMQKFSTIVETAYNHIDMLETQQTSSVVSCKLLVYQKARMESALNALPFAVLVADESGQVTYISNKIHHLLGTSEGESLGRNLSDFSENQKMSEFLVGCQAANILTTYQNNKTEIYLEATDKRVAVNPYPLYSHKNRNQLLGTLIVFRDITNEGASQKQNSEFVAHVAHELKSPLNVLHMYSELLIDNTDNTSEKSREMSIKAANVIYDETSRISEMIDNLLNLTMIEIGSVAMQRQSIKVSEFLEDIHKTMSRDKQVEALEFNLIVPHSIGMLTLDKSLIRVAINNLVSNAIKYNRPGGKVDLIAEENEDEIIISVRDTGIGILEEDQKRVFGKFFRSEDDEVRQRSGHGLGLSLVYEIVKLHHGSITLNSVHGEGSEFVMRFSKESNMLRDVV